MKQRTPCKRFALILSLLLVCGLCFTASAVAAANPDFEIDGTTLVKYHGRGGEVTVPDEEAQKTLVKVTMADTEDKCQVGASIPGAVSKVSVSVGDEVKVNDTLIVIEAMKMETNIISTGDGIIGKIYVKEGDSVKSGQLIARLEDIQ